MPLGPWPTVCLLCALVAGCNITAIEDGARFGPVVQVKDFFTSVFLVPTEDGALLVDAGYNKKGKPILRALEAEGLAAEDVSHIFVTHGHGDHVAGLSIFAGAQVLALEAEAELLAEEAPDGVEVRAELEDGERREIGGLSVETLAVPGHTAGNAAYLIDGVLILGDSAQLDGQGRVILVSDRFSDDPERARTSLLELRDRLLARDDEIEAVLFSHSGGLRDPGAFFEMSEP
jgi:glyoxylase-like metal-dependent hydrolase (beta-lactamase superfamily II)